MVKRAGYLAMCFAVFFSSRLIAQDAGAVQLRYRYPPDKAVVYEEHVRMRVEYQQNGSTVRNEFPLKGLGKNSEF